MTLRLFLIRHGSSLEKSPGEQDIDRELSSDGMQEASKLGSAVRSESVELDMIISSSAKRAMETATIFGEQLKLASSRIHPNPELYDASVRTFLESVNNLRDEWGTVGMVGHNPTVSYFAEYVSAAEIGPMEAGSLVEIAFDFNSWNRVSQGSGDFVRYLPASKLGG